MKSASSVRKDGSFSLVLGLRNNGTEHLQIKHIQKAGEGEEK
jgi:hypothetical protein